MTALFFMMKKAAHEWMPTYNKGTNGKELRETDACDSASSSRSFQIFDFPYDDLIAFLNADTTSFLKSPIILKKGLPNLLSMQTGHLKRIVSASQLCRQKSSSLRHSMYSPVMT